MIPGKSSDRVCRVPLERGGDGDMCDNMEETVRDEVVTGWVNSLPIDLFCETFAFCAAVSGSVC